MIRTRLNRRMSATDAAFIYAENERNPMHIGCIEVVEGRLPVQTFTELVNAKLQFVTRYRQVMRPAPFGLGHPSWQDDPDFDVLNHIEVVTVDAPGDETAFKEVASRLFAGMLDRNRPLWKIYVIEGRADGNTGLLWLVHHAMVDGVSGTEIVETVLDTSPRTALPQKDVFDPASADGALLAGREAILDTARDQWKAPVRLFRSAAAQLSRMREAPLRAISSELPEVLGDFLKPVPRLPFNTRKFSGERKLSWGSCSLADIKAIREACGGTVNDVLLATLGGAARRYLKAHKISTRGKKFRAACPVSLRAEEQGGTLGNQVTIMPVDIALDTADPIARLRQVTHRTGALKQLNVAHGVDLALQLFQSMHPLGQSMAASAAMSPGPRVLNGRFSPPPIAHMVCTNVPGPRVPLYAAGRRVLSHVPLLPVVPGMGLAMGVFSYAGTVHFGYIADSNAAPDVDRFAEYVDAAFTELLLAATGVIQRVTREEVSAKRVRRRRVPVAAATAPKTKTAKSKDRILASSRRALVASSRV